MSKVLLVDDSNTALLMGDTVFKQHTSCQVVTARDGQEAVQKALAEKPDPILGVAHRAIKPNGCLSSGHMSRLPESLPPAGFPWAPTDT